MNTLTTPQAKQTEPARANDQMIVPPRLEPPYPPVISHDPALVLAYTIYLAVALAFIAIILRKD
jgi:hypothetical protein